MQRPMNVLERDNQIDKHQLFGVNKLTESSLISLSLGSKALCKSEKKKNLNPTTKIIRESTFVE